MPQVRANGVTLEYATTGDPADPALLLIMGLGAQLTDWRDEFAALLAARRRYVIRFDNRDSGLSTVLDELGPPDLRALMSGEGGKAPYLLSDLAADAVGLLDALGIERAHVTGASMGGMVAQQLVIDHPERVLSLVSIMSTTGDPAVGGSTPEAGAALRRPPAANRDEAIEGGMITGKLFASPGYPIGDDERRARVTAKIDRAYTPQGTARQLAAIVASGDRTAALGRVAVPAVVIHGEDDPLIAVSGGRATAAAIPGAELITFPGMGHDLPEELWPELVAAITRH